MARIIVNQVEMEYANYQIAYEVLSQDKSTNSSRVRFSGILNTYSYDIYWDRGSAQIWDKTVQIGNYYTRRGSYVVVSTDVTLYHNNNGNFSTTLTGSFNTTFISGSTSGVINLPKINRLITLTSTNDFSDVENLVMNFNNPLGYKAKPYMKFYKTGDVSTLLLNIEKEIGDYTSPYTFEFTESELTTILQTLNQSSQYDVYVGIYSYKDTEYQGYSDQKRIFTITEDNPTYTYTKQELNPKVVSILGTSANQTIKGISNLKFIYNISPKKYATTAGAVLIHYDKFLDKRETPYEFEVTPVNQYFQFYTVDSRGYRTTEDFEIPCLDYEPISLNSFRFERLNPTSSDIRLTIDANYFQATYGTTANQPIIQWKLEDGEFNNITDYNIDTENNKLTVNVVLNNVLSYEEKGTFTLLISDLFSEASDKQDVIRGIPLVEMGEFDFQVNGDLLIADKDGENAINVKEIVKQKYSNDEIIVGTWVNGKPIYRKVIDYGYLPNKATRQTNHNIANIDYILPISGVATANNTFITLPRPHTTSTLSVVLEASKTQIIVNTGADLSTFYATVIMEYTKTTD